MYWDVAGRNEAELYGIRDDFIEESEPYWRASNWICLASALGWQFCTESHCGLANTQVTH